MRSFKKLKSNLDSWFTLIELLVVIIIIGILAGIAVIGVSGAQKAASTRACQANGVQLTKALRGYYAANGQWPIAASTVQPSAIYTFTPGDLALLAPTNGTGKFLEAVPPEATPSSATKYSVSVVLDPTANSLKAMSLPVPTPSPATTFCADVTG